ncbi:hypothetical protein GOV12_03155 [Candidatus Pacearchaeota archaeon]|nr:hypothetical protein [Candidatus Pacearchaeota archaeon]
MKRGNQVTVSSIIKTSVVTAFTLTAAFIWKDVILEIVELLFPSQNQLFFKFLVAIITTVFVILAIYIFLKTEREAEIVFDKFSHRNLKKKSK